MCSPVTPSNSCLHVPYCAFLLSFLCTSYLFNQFFNMFGFMNAFIQSINTEHIFFYFALIQRTWMARIVIRKLQRGISGLVLWQQQYQFSAFLIQLECLGIEATKMLCFVVWQCFIPSDMGAVLCMLSSRMTSVRFFWKCLNSAMK